MSNTIKKGIESLKASVKADCEKHENCFNENGCDHEFYRKEPETNPALLAMGIKTCCRHVSKCSHKYCDKYKWVIERAKHYAQKTGKTYEEIIEIWENDRGYWYMNYYQDCNQPLSGRKVDYDPDKMLRNILLLKQEIETWEYAASCLEFDHQQSVRNACLQKAENLTEQLHKLETQKALLEISCFNVKEKQQ